MKITRIAAYGLELPFGEGTHRCRNRTKTGQTGTMVAISTDSGLTGWGEIAPLGAFYSEAFASGALAGVAVLAPELMGADPREIEKIRRTMDATMFGQMDAKTPIDIALWDLFGQACDLPLAECLAGPDVALYCDANGAWSSHDALRFLDATRVIDYVLEQPCARYEENLIVRCACSKPMMLDESCDSLDAVIRIRNDGAADGVTIKMSRFGGITRSRLARDLAVDAGLKETVECVGGAQIISSAIAHMCLSTPMAQRSHTVDFHNWMRVANAESFSDVIDGRMAAPRAPGLCVRALHETFGESLFVVGDGAL